MRSSRRTALHAVYIPKLDAEHLAIFNLVEALGQVVAEGGGAERVQPALRELTARVVEHLSGEERMMRSVAYPSYLWHKRQHDTARQRLQQFTERAGVGEPGAAAGLVDYLKPWLRDHTGLHDRMMAAYMRNFERARRA